MKIKERLALIKAGYSKEEINSMIDEESVNEAPVEESEEKSPVEDYMKVIKALANEVKDLKEAVQTENINRTEIKTATSKSAEDILAELFSKPGKEN